MLVFFFSNFSPTTIFFFFFFNDTATTEIYTLSLHDALPIFSALGLVLFAFGWIIKGMALRANAFATSVVQIGEHTSELQSPDHLVCRLLLEKKKKTQKIEIEENAVCVYYRWRTI